MSNKTELLQKIKALADRGVEGERESAQAILSRLMEQYGISEAELEEDRRETAWFAYSQEIERRLLAQIIYMVTGLRPMGAWERTPDASERSWARNAPPRSEWRSKQIMNSSKRQ